MAKLGLVLIGLYGCGVKTKANLCFPATDRYSADVDNGWSKPSNEERPRNNIATASPRPLTQLVGARRARSGSRVERLCLRFINGVG